MTVLSTGFLVGLALAEFCVASNVGVDAKLGDVFAVGVRPMSVSIAELVAEGRDRSATFRSLLEGLNVSGWIVFVQEGACRLPRVRGCLLHSVGMFDGRRYLRIVLSGPPASRDETIATIGHELQHAVEVVDDPSITKASDISDLYRRIGYVSMKTASGQLYETRSAVRTGVAIREELRRESRRAGHGPTEPR
jgi:hypothetical protein